VSRNSVLEPVEVGWRELDALVESLGPAGLLVTGADGWAVKDHLAHIAAWEQSLVALFAGTDRAAAMGVTETEGGTDALNDQIWKLHRDRTPEETLAYLRQTHEALMKRLSGMSDADLELSYNHYQPNDPRDPSDDRPAVDWVASNTWEHYAEHVAWIQAMLKDRSASR
jgi:Protein of unknown function (DUF1706)